MPDSIGSLNSIDDELARRRRTFSQRRSLSEYAVTLPSQPNDSVGIHPKDDKFRFFKKGRDFQPRKAKHHYTEEELKILETYESAPILPSQTAVYRKWLKDEPNRGDGEAWIIIFLIAIITGTLAFVMRWICEQFQMFSFQFMIDFVRKGETWYVWMYYTILSCTFGMFASIIVVYFCPFAAGSGLPEIIGVLNGCVVRNVLSFKTLVCKCGSVILTVLSRLPVGFEGPMIHIGAMVGACMARPARILGFFNIRKPNSSSSHECDCGVFPKLCRYRDCQERYSFICVGAASGVASAFSSPITGLIFAMEEISSHWSKVQTWRTFVCCILARSTTEILRSLTVSWLEAKHGESSFHIFRLSESALFDMKRTLELSFFIFIPAVIIGAAGGLLGAAFIFVLLKGSKLRRKLLSNLSNAHMLRVVQVLEVLLIAVICSSIVIGSMHLFPCKYIRHEQPVFREHGRKSLILQSFNCKSPVNSHYEEANRTITQEGGYHEGASLLLGSWEQMIRNLFSRRTHGLFSISSLALCFFLFWTFSTWTSMTSIASGLLIPQLAIGALYGRILGEVCYSIIIHHVIDGDDFSNWEWVDPGAFALLGAASFLSGTSRLPITSVVMMVEMTNDINMALLIMLCVMLAKFTGDRFTHSLYHSVLEYKCIPYLDTNLKVYYEGAQVSMELFTSSDVMKSPVMCVNVRESVKVLANLLLDTNHGAFPVVDNECEVEKPFLGIISRLELIILLTKTERFNSKEIGKDDLDRLRLSYPEYSSSKLKDTTTANAILNKYSTNVIYKNIYVNLLPYTNTSTPTVSEKFSLYRTYLMFTALGLRHLVVTNPLNNVSGIITRKDLLGFAVESNITRVIRTKGFHDNTVTDTDQSVGVDIEDDIHVGIQSTVLEEEENESDDDTCVETNDISEKQN